jgi:adenine-specific DNA-methyltransferase
MNDGIRETPHTTPNLRTGLARQLQELVPEAITDGKVDVDKLKELLASDAADDSERFGLFWPGKKRALRAAQEPTTATLKPDFENSKDWDTTKNVFVEGDNLEVLKILQKHYHAKIKVIYIDPPYNTGKDFIYPDNYKEGLDTYLEWTRQVNEDGKKITSNAETEGRYHSNWLNMMYPRLKLARNLMADNGLIFISIDDHEASNLKRLCDEVFGERNFVAQFVWNTEGHTDNQFPIKINHEYVIAYARDSRSATFGYVVDPNTRTESNLWSGFAENSITKNGPANPPSEVVLPAGFPVASQDAIILESSIIPAGLIDAMKASRLTSNQLKRRFGEIQFPLRLDPIHAENGILTKDCRLLSGWANVSKLRQFIDGGCESLDDGEGELQFYLSRTGVIYYRRERGQRARNILSVLRNMGTTEKSRSELEQMGLIFSYPKPTELISYLIKVGSSGPGDIVLDFFAGSGTTAHAVMQLNAEVGSQRRYITVQLPEPTPEDSEARKAGFVTIADVSRKRIELAGAKVKTDAPPTTQDDLDTGFRSYKLADTNFSKWHIGSDVELGRLEQHLIELRDSAADDATTDALLTELLLKQGHSLTEEIASAEIAGLDVRVVGDNLVAAYLNQHVKPTLEQLRALVDSGPSRIIMLEDAFQGDDELKTNLAQLCKSKAVELWTA